MTIADTRIDAELGGVADLDDRLDRERRAHLARVLRDLDVPALLTCDPFSIRYATGTRNMLVHGLTGPDRITLVVPGFRTVLWEFAGCEHLVADAAGVDEVRLAPALNAKKSPDFAAEARSFADEVTALMVEAGLDEMRLAVETLGGPVTDALRTVGVEVIDGNGPMQHAMMIKQPSEVEAMRAAVSLVEAAAAEMRHRIRPGLSEQEVWSEFQRGLLAGGGELVVTRLLQAGVRTFPYFQEASAHVITPGDLVCFDTDAISLHGYSVDFSRTFFVAGRGAETPTVRQRQLHAIALEQLRHNAGNLGPGVSFEEFARDAFEVPPVHRDHGYYQLAHGLGLAGGQPNIPRADAGPYPLRGGFEPGMVICVESYVGDPASGQGVKLEDQFLVTETGAETMTTSPFDPLLS